MEILFLSTAHNSLSQRAFVELSDLGHNVYVQIASSNQSMIDSVKLYKPDIVIAPFLKKYIPESIWSQYTCIIIHPGIIGDRGPSSLDWAILNGESEWGVTLLEANGELDGGDIWSSQNFIMTPVSKSNLYRHEITEAAIKCLLETIERYECGNFIPKKLDYNESDVKGRDHKPMKQKYRSIDWSEPTAVIAKKIRSADSPADESWRNINAINDLIREIILTDTHLVISAMRGNAAAGGVILALATDTVFARNGIALNPHYKKMGLYGSEYWTYLLPERVGNEKSIELTEECLPISTKTAKKIGLIDGMFDGIIFKNKIIEAAEELAMDPLYEEKLKEKQRKRKEKEKIKPLEVYRNEELVQMFDNFYGSDKSYHIARKRFVYKLSCTSELPK